MYKGPPYPGFAHTPSSPAASAITGERLAGLTMPSHIITSRDDPVIPAADLARLARPPALTIELTERGGHCLSLIHISEPTRPY